MGSVTTNCITATRYVMILRLSRSQAPMLTLPQLNFEPRKDEKDDDESSSR